MKVKELIGELFTKCDLDDEIILIDYTDDSRFEIDSVDKVVNKEITINLVYIGKL